MTIELIDFLRGKGRDASHRRLADIWAMSDDELEADHNFIQWMFPLDVSSGAQPDAPTLDSNDLDQIRKDMTIRGNLRRSLDRMLGFYGFAWGPERRSLVLSPHFPQQAANWLSRNNHNFLRITRILRCLMLAGEVEAAKVLLLALEGLYKRGYGAAIGTTSLDFWRGAVYPPNGTARSA
jgi:hypothetical protein